MGNIFRKLLSYSRLKPQILNGLFKMEPSREDVPIDAVLAQLANTTSDQTYPLQMLLYEQLLNASLLLPVPNNVDLQIGLPITLVENPLGERAIPVFTNEKHLTNWDRNEQQYVPLSLDILAIYAMEAKVDYLIINLAGDNPFEIPFHDFCYLAESLLPPPLMGIAPKITYDPMACFDLAQQNSYKKSETVIPANTFVRLEACPDLPDGLMEQVTHVLLSHCALISRAYLFQISLNDAPPQPALGIYLLEAQKHRWVETLLPTLQAILSEMLEPHHVFNLFLLNEAGNLEAEIQKRIQPLLIFHPETDDSANVEF